MEVALEDGVSDGAMDSGTMIGMTTAVDATVMDLGEGDTQKDTAIYHRR